MILSFWLRLCRTASLPLCDFALTAFVGFKRNEHTCSTFLLTMDAEINLMAERMPSLISTRFDDRRATGLAGGWEVLRIFGRRKKAPLLRRARSSPPSG